MRFRAVIAALLALNAGCADFSRGAPSPDVPGEPDHNGQDPINGDVISYAESIHSLMMNGCLNCHAAGASAGSTALVFTDNPDADFLEALRFINEDSPQNSRLLSKGAGQGHGGGAIYSQGTTEYQAILRWISQGAHP